MRPNRRLTDAERQRILELAARGESTLRIMRTTGHCQATVLRVLAQAGVA